MRGPPIRAPMLRPRPIDVLPIRSPVPPRPIPAPPIRARVPPARPPTPDPGPPDQAPGPTAPDPRTPDPGAGRPTPDPAIPIEPVVPPTSAPDDVLRVENIAKRFGPVTALRDVSLHLRKGEVLGLLGDNGAGKSTLIKILCGFQKQDSGSMFLHGQPYEPRSVDDGRSRGIETVYQDLALIDELPVYHNLFLRRERVHHPLPFLANGQMKREARAALDEIGINIPRIDVSVARLSGGQRQAIAVARTVSSDADIILLDEPLAAMGAKEGSMILDLVARLKEEGRVSIVMILHNYVHVLQAC